VLESGTLARVVTRWTPDAMTSGASIAIGDAPPTLLVRGASAAAIERGEHVAIVAYETYEDATPFRFRVVSSGALGAEQTFARPGTRRGDVPFAVAIAPIAGRGFALFYEEVQSDDPSAARTYLFQLDLDGHALDAGVEIQVPWPIAAAAWNGHGYHLALIYPGGGQGMRLSMVSLSPEGLPEQHPDWSSAAGLVGDVHLVVVGAEIHAHYRGGSGGEHWMETDVTAIGGWGSDRRHATDHGHLEAGVSFAVDAAGHAQRVPSRDDGIASR
jgi:hypothetical protein